MPGCGVCENAIVTVGCTAVCYGVRNVVQQKNGKLGNIVALAYGRDRIIVMSP
jgi:hypothetical protein